MAMENLYDDESIRREVIRIINPKDFNVLNVKVMKAKEKNGQYVFGLGMNITDDIKHLEPKFVEAGAYVTDGGKSLIFNEEFYKLYTGEMLHGRN